MSDYQFFGIILMVLWVRVLPKWAIWLEILTFMPLLIVSLIKELGL